MFCSVYSVFIMPTGTLRLPWLRFFHAFSSVVRQMPGYNSQRRGTARTLPKLIVLFCVLFLCKCVLYCTVLYCTVLHCTVLYCTVLYCTVLCCAVLYFTVLYCTVLYYCHWVSTQLQLTNISIYIYNDGDRIWKWSQFNWRYYPETCLK